MLVLLDPGSRGDAVLTTPRELHHPRCAHRNVPDRVDRIGYESLTTGRFDVRRKEFQRVTCDQPVQLEGIEVGARAGASSGRQGEATARVWDEARKALEAQPGR